MVCDVCENVFVLDMNSTSEENSILECLQCKINVHQLCYGVEKYSASWLCDFCDLNNENQIKKCELCPSTMGALKPTTTDKWVHVVCALFTPWVIINNPTTMQPVNIQKIPKKSFGQKCYICERKGLYDVVGACINCSAARCKRNLHVKCGQVAGTLKEKTDVGGALKFVVFCEEHIDAKQPRISFNSINSVLTTRTKLNNRVKAKAQNAQWLLTDVSNLVKNIA